MSTGLCCLLPEIFCKFSLLKETPIYYVLYVHLGNLRHMGVRQKHHQLWRSAQSFPQRTFLQPIPIFQKMCMDSDGK